MYFSIDSIYSSENSYSCICPLCACVSAPQNALALRETQLRPTHSRSMRKTSGSHLQWKTANGRCDGREEKLATNPSKNRSLLF